MGDVLLLDGLRLETGLQHGRGQRGHRAVGQRPDDLCRVVWRQLQSTRIDLGGELGRLLTRPCDERRWDMALDRYELAAQPIRELAGGGPGERQPRVCGVRRLFAALGPER